MMNNDEQALPRPKPPIGLILTGGGARAAYQVGVLKAIAETLSPDAPTPFRVICGTSAGAINAAVLACHADNFTRAISQLVEIWQHLHTEDIFRTEARLAVFSALRWFSSMLLGDLGRFTPISILDNSPLREMLHKQLPLDNVQHWIESGLLDAFSVTAAGYHSGSSVTFFQGKDKIQSWQRTRRQGIPRPITLEHLLASSAIPIIFPAVRIGYEFFGDGSMRQLLPLSAALHLGAQTLLVIGVRNERSDEQPDKATSERLQSPTLGQISGYVLDTLFMDSLSMDIERLERVNHTLEHIPSVTRDNTLLRKVDLMTIFPSQDVRVITAKHRQTFPKSVRFLLRGIGAMNQGGLPLMSYLLFEEGFCRELIELGYRDGVVVKERLLMLLKKNAGINITNNKTHVSRETNFII